MRTFFSAIQSVHYSFTCFTGTWRIPFGWRTRRQVHFCREKDIEEREEETALVVGSHEGGKGSKAVIHITDRVINWTRPPCPLRNVIYPLRTQCFSYQFELSNASRIIRLEGLNSDRSRFIIRRWRGVGSRSQGGRDVRNGTIALSIRTRTRHHQLDIGRDT